MKKLLALALALVMTLTLAAAAAETTTFTYESRGVQVPATLVTPDGVDAFPVVVLAHGHGGNREENVGFAAVADALAAQGIGSIRMDFPGCGESTESFQNNVLSNMKADVLAAVDYAKAAYMGLSYTPSEELLKVLQREVYVSVVSDNRMAFAAAGVLQTTGCLVSPYDALCYAGVQDYRAKSGQNRMCLVLSQRDPALDATVLADALGIPGKQIEAYLRR